MDRPLVGAIRWDAWHGDLDVPGQVMQRTLLPEKYHYRLPYFTKFKPDGSLSITHITQEEIDEEIKYAKDAGLDYFAFCMYERGTPLALARDRYLDSQVEGKPKWCAILGVNVFPKDEDYEWLCREFEKPQYLRVAQGRPMMFMFDAQQEHAEILDRLKKCCADMGIAPPYIAAMGWDAEKIAGTAKIIGAHALSAYCTPGENGQSYGEQCAREQDTWKRFKDAGMPVLPWVTTGWDPRPRMDTKTPWVTYAENSWARVGSPEEIVTQLKSAMAFARSDGCEAEAVLIYAWNEFDEGGWLCPTLFELERDGGPKRIEALAGVLKE